MSILRKRSEQHKIHLPATTRENQYVLAKFALTDSILEKFQPLINLKGEKPYQALYEKLSSLFFSVCNEFGIETCHFVANDKFTRVRFSPERLTSQTEQQILFLYNPQYHFNQNAYFDAKVKAEKVTLVFLSNGENIRFNTAQFYKKVTQAIAVYAEQLAIAEGEIRVCDHQHLTYDLFARDKSDVSTKAHKLRAIHDRYKTQDVDLPAEHDELTYAIVDLPVTRRIQALAEIDANEQEKYNPLYTLISDAVINAAKHFNVANGAVIANGLVPVVRESKHDIVVANGELQMLGYNRSSTSYGIICKWDADKLVDTVQLIFVAGKLPKSEMGYGKFLFQIESALKMVAKNLQFIPEKEELIVRFHQHIGLYR